MEIKKANLKWRRPLIPLDLSKVNSIALHHMAHPTADIPIIHEWHLKRDNGTWKGFGYNYWIGLDGIVWEGRGLNIGAAVTGKNNTIISIGFQGDYDKTINNAMPQAQYESGIWIIKYLIQKIPTIITVQGHKYWEDTSCPGKYFPLQRMKNAISNNKITIEEFQSKYNLAVDGIIGPITIAKMLEVITIYEKYKKLLKEMLK